MTQPDPTDRADLRQRVQKVLAGFLAGQASRLDAVSEELGPVADALAEFLLDGGKRLRPAFCYWGWRGAGGADTEGVVAAASCLELLHACALIHDDVMDGSDTRRGRPAVHRRFSALHRGESWRGDPEAFGLSAAILLGDICLIWADEMLNTSGLPSEALLRAQPVYDGMRSELMAGQYLDLLEQALGGGSIDRALRVARYKSAKYTIERPLQLGGALAGAPPEVLAGYSAYGLPLGEAFQLRDDVLGVFGDPSQTGKPAGDDLREGKRTVLIASTLDRATPAQSAVVRRHLGDPHLDEVGVAELRAVIEGTGALAEAERLISRLTDDALLGLETAPVEPESRLVLGELAAAATSRRL
ncbi:MAG: polyprenyl synthetase family protein [Actinomycetota bacterium]|nr:polyprenyl synthetase family protein [Actinomycetota bacterium]